MRQNGIGLVAMFFVLLLIVGSFQVVSKPKMFLDDPTQPDQPSSGPGGSNYSHFGVRKTRYGYGDHMYWIFEPYGPKPESAPLIIFNHGWSAMFPICYREWIHHLVKRGNIVVYPRYQSRLYVGFEDFYPNAVEAVRDALVVLQNGTHVQPELDKVAITGHSLGGGITAYMAAEAADENLPIPKAVMPVQPAFGFVEPVDVSKINSSTLMLVVIGEDDTVVSPEDAKHIFYNSTHVSLSQKDFIIQVTDTYGEPDMVADHIAPVCLPFFNTVDAMDYYSTWKLFDALTDFAFYGINGEYCLGDTPEQRFMGLWSDGVAVNELIVTDSP